MDIKAGERILNKAQAGRELEELNEHLPADAQLGPLEASDVVRFNAVTSAMQEVLTQAQSSRIDERLTPAMNSVLEQAKLDHAESRLPERYRLALEQLYTAATATHAQHGTFVSAVERGILLNQALRHLQPILALGLRPDFREGRAQYAQLVTGINAVRRDISAASALQLVKPQRREALEETELDEPVEDDADSGDSDGDDDGAGAADTPTEPRPPSADDR
ncbi:MAG: hypothetical protein Tsb0020_26180 [Haliangiales bacterium]